MRGGGGGGREGRRVCEGRRACEGRREGRRGCEGLVCTCRPCPFSPNKNIEQGRRNIFFQRS